MEPTEERREPLAVSGIRFCVVLDICRNALVLVSEREANLRLKGLQGQWSTMHQKLCSVNMLWIRHALAKAKAKIVLLFTSIYSH